MVKKYNKSKKYSLDDRQKYHQNIVKKVVDKFTVNKNSYSKTDWAKVDAEIQKSSKLQYSDGFTASRHTDLTGRSKSFVKGFNAARKAEEKSRTIKF